MSITASSSPALLDVLQIEVDGVVCQIGRLFAAANSGSAAAPISQATRLKQSLPGSISRFHEALDQLEDELHNAKLVMLRDLALWRERTGVVVHANTSNVTVKVPTLEDDVEMIDVNLKTPKDVDNVIPDAQTAPKPTEMESETNVEQDHLPPAVTEGLTASDADAKKTADTTNAASIVNHDLQIDTKATTVEPTPASAPQTDDDQPPDTGTLSNNADLDSLFNDPISASGDNPTTEFDSGGDFDFGAFNASLGDNNDDGDDSIAALLPGLQDYANNTNDSGEPDFDTLFAADGPATDEKGKDNGNNPPLDSFDDLMADFDAGGYGGENDDDLAFSFT